MSGSQNAIGMSAGAAIGMSVGAFGFGVFLTQQLMPRQPPTVHSFASFSTHQALPTDAKDVTYVLPQADEHVPGWLFERLFHEEGVHCPWLKAGQPSDAGCVRRTSEIKALRASIATCEVPLRRTNAVLGHRGAPLVAPEETVASWAIGASSGAGFLECDVSTTADLAFVCRHSTCDLHHTTDLVANHPDLNAKCTRPFVPGSGVEPKCCTYDFTAAELQKLCAQMDSEGGNASAATAAGYWTGPPDFRTGSIAAERCHSIVAYDEYLDLMWRSGYNVIPELKDTTTPGLEAFLSAQGLDYRYVADKFADAVGQYGFGSEGPGLMNTMQTFDHRVAEHWKLTRPHVRVEYMWRTVPPEGSNCTEASDCGGRPILEHLAKLGVELFSPPMQRLLASGPGHSIVPSETTAMLRDIGVLEIGTWSLERQGCGGGLGPCGDRSSWYYGTLEGESTFQHVDVLRVLDALFRDVGISYIFSDFPATAAAYVNCVQGGDTRRGARSDVVV